MIEVNSKRKSMPSLHDPKKLTADIKNHPCYQQWISNDMDYAGCRTVPLSSIYLLLMSTIEILIGARAEILNTKIEAKKSEQGIPPSAQTPLP